MARLVSRGAGSKPSGAEGNASGSGPVRALTLRQPWAWMVVRGGKTIENRTWHRPSLRGPILIHAGAAMTRSYYDAAAEFAARVPRRLRRFSVAGERRSGPSPLLPAFERLERGGIVGRVTIEDALEPPRADDGWRMAGQWGYVLGDVAPLPFVACKGMLGAWTVPADVLAELDRQCFGQYGWPFSLSASER